ncbi:MAG TPA: hypothetical protein VK939_15260 [Longimicrobiales bacterium]|nr:hypothetical protein [Longimicrobiales bacterium]
MYRPTMRFAVAILIAGILGSCDAPNPAEPPVAVAYGALSEGGTGTFVDSGEVYFPCLDEFVRVEVEVPYQYRLVVTPGGNVLFADHFLPGQATGTITGLTSDVVWSIQRLISPEIIRTAPGSVYMFTANQWWMSDAGPSIHVHSTYRIIQNSQGEFTSERADFRCRLF